MRRSVAESGTTPAPQAQHVRQAAAGEASRPAEASEPGWIRRRRDWAREVLDVHVVRANGSDSLEVLRDLVHGIERRGASRPVELLREKDVLGDLNGVLQQPMDEDDVDPDEVAPLLDGLGGDLADVRDELQLQVVA